MQGPLLLLVNGLPCTGKSTLATYLSEHLRIPLITKDGIKETLFDTLGYSDRDWSRRLGAASVELLFHVIEAHLRLASPLIAECNFHADLAGPRLIQLGKQYPYCPIQIVCRTEGHVLVERFRHRAASDQRHPGHIDHQNVAELESLLLNGDWEPLPIDGPLIVVDTTDFAVVNYKGILQQIQSLDTDTP